MALQSLELLTAEQDDDFERLEAITSQHTSDNITDSSLDSVAYFVYGMYHSSTHFPLLLNFINILNQRSTTLTPPLLLLMHHLLSTLFNILLQTDPHGLTTTSKFVMSFSCTLDKEIIYLF
jgi:hypothetical protein